MDNDAKLKSDEQSALQYARRMKEFYEFLATYLVLAVLFLFVFRGETVVYLVFAGLGVALIVQGLMAYEIITFMSPNWERRIAEKKLGRKL